MGGDHGHGYDYEHSKRKEAAEKPRKCSKRKEAAENPFYSSGRTKQEQAAIINYLSVIPISPAIPEFGMVINQPVLLNKDDKARLIGWGGQISEVFEVRVISGRKTFSKIHGSLHIKCGGYGGGLNIFERSRLNPQIVHRNESLELTGPTRALISFDHVMLSFRLMDGRNEVASGEQLYFWDPDYDCPDFVRHDVYDGKKGSVELIYVVYLDAVVAIIEIKLKSNDSVQICGTITAYNSMFPCWKSLLFCKKKNLGEYHNVEGDGEEQMLPLLRSVVAVSIHSVSILKCESRLVQREEDGRLMIEMDLVNFGDEGRIAKGVLEFPVRNYGNHVGSISTKYGELQVKVTLKHIYEHLPMECLLPPSLLNAHH